MRYGLLPLPKDTRDFSVGAIYTLPALKELPDSFDVDTLDVKDQKESDFCAAFSSCTVSEVQEDVRLAPEWTFAMSKTLSGNVDDYGQDLRTIMKTHVKFGALEKRDSPFSVETRSPEFLRDIKNWPDLRHKALWHKKASFMDCKGPYDAFDNIRATIWKFRKENRVVESGILWGWDIHTERINDIGNPEGGHAIVYKGWKGEYLVMQNSYGRTAGRNGTHLVHRSVVNEYVGMYGAFIFQDITVDEARWYKTNNKKVDASWIMNLLMSMVNLVK
jgi:hypothetical protein